MKVHFYFNTEQERVVPLVDLDAGGVQALLALRKVYVTYEEEQGVHRSGLFDVLDVEIHATSRIAGGSPVLHVELAEK